MQYNDHVTHQSSTNWPRCKSVEVQGERLVCVLDWSRKYDLTKTYRYRFHCRPHIDFLNVATDNDLAAFVRRWGPLWLVYRTGFVGEPEVDKRRYWNFHRRIRAWLNLTQAFKSRGKSSLGDAILEFVAADDEESQRIGVGDLGTCALALSLTHTLKPDNHPREWIPRADVSQLRRAASFCISWSVSSRLDAVWRNGRAEISWKPNVETLAQAIEWMFWHDIAGRRPLTFCVECGTAFLPESAHSRKYCDTPCAHRAAVREYRKRLKSEASTRLG